MNLEARTLARVLAQETLARQDRAEAGLRAAALSLLACCVMLASTIIFLEIAI